MGSIRDAIALLEQDAFMAKIDLMNAYGQIPLNQEAAGYLVASTAEKLWLPLVMPQGTSCAPLIFTCVLKMVRRKLKGYLNDCLLW